MSHARRPNASVLTVVEPVVVAVDEAETDTEVLFVDDTVDDTEDEIVEL